LFAVEEERRAKRMGRENRASSFFSRSLGIVGGEGESFLGFHIFVENFSRQIFGSFM
jgi:hypothetical protein